MTIVNNVPRTELTGRRVLLKVPAVPIYEYLCQKCEHVLEVQQKISDPPPEDCPECGAGAPARILSASNIGSVASGRDAAACDRSPEPSCFSCGKAGTGC